MPGQQYGSQQQQKPYDLNQTSSYFRPRRTSQPPVVGKTKKLKPVRDEFDEDSYGELRSAITQEIAQNYMNKKSNPITTAASIQKF